MILTSLTPAQVGKITQGLVIAVAMIAGLDNQRCPVCGKDVYLSRTNVRTTVRCCMRSCDFRVSINSRGLDDV